MIYNETAYGLLEAQRARRETVNANAGRAATVSTTWTTKGIGEVRITEPFYFGLLFLEEPVFTSGVVLDMAGKNPDLVKGHYPRAQAGIYEWVKPTDDHFTGAYLFFTVDTNGPGQTPGVEPNYVIHHHLQFQGQAVKTLALPWHFPSFLHGFG